MVAESTAKGFGRINLAGWALLSGLCLLMVFVFNSILLILVLSLS